MTKHDWFDLRGASRLLLVVLLVTLLHFSRSKLHRSRESALEESRRSVSTLSTAVSHGTNKTDALSVRGSVCFSKPKSPDLEKFVDPLPILPYVHVSDGRLHIMIAYKTTQTFHRDLPPTTVYAFGRTKSAARVPGPALIAKRNVPTYIRWENQIEDIEHILPVDGTLKNANPARGGVPIVPHLHGMETESKYDGHPEAWFTRQGDTGPKYVTQNYIYPNTPLPALMWYHDHTVGMSRLNVAAGLAGPYIIRGNAGEEPAGLPNGDREILLSLEDRAFFDDGSTNFPAVGDDVNVHPSWCPAYYGDTIVVNGKVWPYVEVLPCKYRLRILNAATDRYFDLSLDRQKMTFVKIGTDGGYLAAPVILDKIILAPGERVDCVVDFGGLPNGTKILIKNSAPAPYPGGAPGLPPFDPESGPASVLQFRVETISSSDWSTVPTTLGNLDAGGNRWLTPPATDKIHTRRFELSERIGNAGKGVELLLANRTWDDPATELVPLTSMEIWEFIGLTPGIDHPIHIHLIKFQLLSVQQLNITRYNHKTCDIQETYGNFDTCFLNVSRGPNAQEIGWKDTISVATGAVTRVLLRFSPQDGDDFHFDPTTEPGYVWHCHLLSHEDNAMMRPLLIKGFDYRPDPAVYSHITGSGS
ncbi:unnamed protein product [Calypogeia fissa]